MRRFAVLMSLTLASAPLLAAEDPLIAPVEEKSASAWSWFGDLMLRYDRVTDIPRPVEPDIRAAFGRARLGVLYDPIPTLQFGAAVKLAESSIDNSENRSYNLNERANDIALDQAFVRWRPNDTASLLAGKAVFPLELSPIDRKSVV